MKYRLLFLMALILAMGQEWASADELNGNATITASVESVDFGDVEVGYTVVKSFRVYGHGLSDNINVTLDGRGSHFYQVTPETIDAQAAENGVKVTLKCNPISTYFWPADVVLSSTNADDVVIPVSAEPYYPEFFLSKQTVQFEAYAGQMVTKTGAIRFADAEVPPHDPNTPVVMLNLDMSAGGNLSDDYSITLDGADKCQFAAYIVKSSAIAKICTVAITYMPRTTGSHDATITAYCSRAGVPDFTFYLHGESTDVLGDLNNDGRLSVGDVAGMIDLLLNGDDNEFNQISDFNNDGRFSIADVAGFINLLLEQ